MKDIVTSAGVVVAADPFAAKAGTAMLKQGGNAVDAVIAAMLSECVVQPHNIGLGGYAGTMVIYSAKHKKVFAIDFDSTAPAAASPGMFPPEVCTDNWDIASDGGSIPPGINESGCMCITAPPIVAGAALALERFGTMTFSDVALPAQMLAEDGFPMYPLLAKAFSLYAARAAREDAQALLHGGSVPQDGETFVQKDLARLISRLRNEGPAALYRGEIARAIISRIKRGGGIIEESDFAAVSPRIEEPLAVGYGDYKVYTPAPPSGGLTSLQILKVMEMAGLAQTDLASPRYYSLLIEAARHAWAERFEYMGDPVFVDVPVEEMLSDRHAREILDKIESRALPNNMAESIAGTEHTVHLVAADKDHNMASLTATHGSWFGSMTAVDGLGLVLGHGMSRFDPIPGLPNSIAPGKRMQHNMSPLIITRDGEPYCSIGLPGGRKIVNGAALLAHSITEFGLTCGEAIALPRFHVDGPGAASVDSSELAELMNKDGYSVQLSSNRLGGPTAGIMFARETGLFMAASEAGEQCIVTE